MALFKRTFTSLYTKIDQLVGEIENHDALIQAAITEQKQKIAAAKVQLRRLQDNDKRLQEKATQYTLDESRWASRAVREAGTNEAQALACLQRRQKLRLQLEKITAMQKEYHQSSAQMKSNIARCEQELESMVQKHEIMRARQSTADAMHVVNRAGAADLNDISTCFDRWEIRISQGEMLNDCAEEFDELEQEYLSAENEQELRHELAELLREQKLEDDLS